MFEVTDYHALDAEEIRGVLRSSDIRYLLATNSDKRVLEILEDAFDRADKAYTFHHKGEVVAIMGFKGQNAWLQTSRLTDGHAKAVIRCGREAISLLPKQQMYCIAPKDDERVLLLCKALGFTTQTVEYPNYKGSGIDHVALWRNP